MNKKKKGFTLIELIVVIAILGILAAIAVPKLSGFLSSSKTSADKSTAATIAKTVEQYNSANNAGLTNVPSPKQLVDANLLDAKSLVPQDTTHPGFIVTVTGGIASVSYSDTASAATDTSWQGAAVGNALY